MSAPVKVKRDGPRGWHWIAAENYNPAIHELVDGDAPAPVEPEAPAEPEPEPEPVPELPPASAEKLVPKPRAKKSRRRKGAR